MSKMGKIFMYTLDVLLIGGIIAIVLYTVLDIPEIRKTKREKEAAENDTIYDSTYIVENFEVLSQDIEEINAQIDSMSVTLNELQEKLNTLESALN